MPNFQSSQQYLELMLKDKKKHIQIIATFAITKKYSFDNFEQIQRFITRHTRAAKLLDCYDISKIKGVMDFLEETADYKWTLETVLKHIDENISKLRGEEPILTLKNGETIFDIKRLKELEQSKQIYWTGKVWKENITTTN